LPVDICSRTDILPGIDPSSRHRWSTQPHGSVSAFAELPQSANGWRVGDGPDGGHADPGRWT
jgi:hypothetical protein